MIEVSILQILVSKDITPQAILFIQEFPTKFSKKCQILVFSSFDAKASLLFALVDLSLIYKMDFPFGKLVSPKEVFVESIQLFTHTLRQFISLHDMKRYGRSDSLNEGSSTSKG